MPLFRPYRLQVSAVIVLIVVTSTIGIINPLLIQAVFNKALFVPGGPNLHLLYVLVGVMALVPVVNGAIGIVQTYETTRVGQQVMRDLRNRLYAHLETLPLSFFTNTKTGEIQSRLQNDVGGVETVVTSTASTILANVVTFISSIVAMIIISWQLTIVAVITVPAFFWLTKTVGDRRRQVSRSTQESLAAMSAITEETLSVSGVLLAKVFGNQTRDIGRYQRENQRLVGLEVRQQMIGQGFYAVVQSFLSITPALIYLTAGLLIANHHAVSAGTIVAFTTLQTRLYFPIGQLLQVSVELRSSLALFDRVFEYLDVVPDIVDAPDAVDLPVTEAGGRVALRDVYFRYPGVSTDALSGVSLGANPGHLVALVGPSGAGKTTISYLIPRLYDVTAGAVEVDGLDVRHVRQASLAAAIGFVTQESYLFHDTVLANIRYGRPERVAGGSGGGGAGGVHPRPDHGILRWLRHRRRRARVPAVGRGEAAPGHRPRPAARPAHPDPGRGDVGPGHRQRTGSAESAGRPDGLADDDCHRSPAVHHRQRGQHLRHRRRPGRGIRLAPRSAARGRAVRVAVRGAVRRRARPVAVPRRRHHDRRNGAPARPAADEELAPARAARLLHAPGERDSRYFTGIG